MLNPSTADATQDDPTIRKCRGFTERLGYKRFDVGNLFAYRTTYPKELYQNQAPIGPDNDSYLLDIARRCDFLILAWGKHGKFLNRQYEVRETLRAFDCKYLRLNKDLTPAHPLMLPYELSPIKWDFAWGS